MCRQGKFHPPNLEKTVDNSPHIGYNIPCQQPADIQKVKILGICIVVVRQTLTLFVGVRFSHPQPNPTAAQSAAVFSGHSAAGSAPGSGLGGRGFKSRCSDQKTDAERHPSFFVPPGAYPRKCNGPNGINDFNGFTAPPENHEINGFNEITISRCPNGITKATISTVSRYPTKSTKATVSTKATKCPKKRRFVVFVVYV